MRSREPVVSRFSSAIWASGDVKIRIGQRWPLAEAPQAHIALEKRETTGSLLLIP